MRVEHEIDYTMTKTILVCLAVCAAPLSFAQLNPIGEFAGSFNEGFEGFANYNSGLVDTMDIMGGSATLSSNPVNSNQLFVYEPGVANWGFGSNGTAQAHSGAKALGLYNNFEAVNVTLTFDVEMLMFGGWFGTDSNNGNVLDITFRDAVGAQIGSVQSISTNDGTLVWLGVESTIGIKSIDFGTNFAPGMDDLQANAVPEPASVIAIGIGVALLALRRRSA